MNRFISSVFIAITMTPLYAFAAEGTSSPVAATPMTESQDTVDSGKMQEKMLRMHEHMHKIMKTKEGVERERLLQEHRMMIEENMRMMHGMMGSVDCESVSKN